MISVLPLLCYLTINHSMVRPKCLFSPLYSSCDHLLIYEPDYPYETTRYILAQNESTVLSTISRRLLLTACLSAPSLANARRFMLEYKVAGECSICGVFSEIVTYFNSLWPSVVIWWHWSGSILPQVMACCLMATSQHMSKCWLVINEWHSPKIYHGRSAQDINL